MLQLPKRTVYINPKDLTINITDHKVKITYTPTSTVIESSQNKCPYKNKASALLTLRKILLEKSAS